VTAAIAEAMRALAHDLANCAAVFEMEVGELTVQPGGPAPGVAVALRDATDRLRGHVGDLRELAGSHAADAARLDQLLALALRFSSREARRALNAVPGERAPATVRAPQLLALVPLLVAIREISVASRGAGLVSASVAPRQAASGGTSGGSVRLGIAFDAAALQAPFLESGESPAFDLLASPDEEPRERSTDGALAFITELVQFALADLGTALLEPGGDPTGIRYLSITYG
jgi:hypothetical protein